MTPPLFLFFLSSTFHVPPRLFPYSCRCLIVVLFCYLSLLLFLFIPRHVTSPLFFFFLSFVVGPVSATDTQYFFFFVVWNLYTVDAHILEYHFMSLTNAYTCMAPNPYQDRKLDQYTKKFSPATPQLIPTSLVKTTTLLNCFCHSLIHLCLYFHINGITEYLSFWVKLISCSMYFWDAPVLFHVFIICSFLFLALKKIEI